MRFSNVSTTVLLAVERHPHGKMRVRKFFKICLLKQNKTYLRNIVPEQLIQLNHVTLQLDGIASFVIKGIEARSERKANS